MKLLKIALVLISTLIPSIILDNSRISIRKVYKRSAADYSPVDSTEHTAEAKKEAYYKVTRETLLAISSASWILQTSFL